MFMLVANAAALGGVAALVAWYHAERAAIRAFAAERSEPAANRLHVARQLGGAIYTSIPRRDDDPEFLHAALAPIGAAPTAVIRDGGCCSGISRLYIVALDTLGIDAAQITLYHAAGHAQHCLVEVVADGVRQVIDPTYGFAFETDDGRPMSLADLQRGAVPRFAALPHSARASYPDNDYYAFDYVATKTANWTRSWSRRSAYSVLSSLRFVDVDRLRLPAALEWPHLILASALTLGAIGVNCLAAMM